MSLRVDDRSRNAGCLPALAGHEEGGLAMNRRKRRDDALYRKNRLPAYERAGGVCENCGAPAAEIHHITFRSHCGTSDLDNLIVLCRDCHEKAHGPDAKAMRESFREIRRNGKEI